MINKRNKLLTLVFAFLAAIILVACSNKSDDTNTTSVEESSTSKQSSDVDTTDSDDDKDDDTDSSSESDKNDDDDDASLTKTVKLVDGTELTYRYKTTVKPGSYSKIDDDGNQTVLSVREDGTFQINRPGVLVSTTQPDGSFDINAQVKKEEDGTLGDYIQFQANDGTYQIVSKNSTYGLYDGAKFTVNLESGTHMGQDFDRYYSLLEDNGLPKVQEFTERLEDIIEYIEDTFGK